MYFPDKKILFSQEIPKKTVDKQKKFFFEQHTELEQLRYLEQLIDFEGDIKRGPLSAKDVLIYSYAKTGTSTIYNSIRQYLQSACNCETPCNRLLYSHSHLSLIDNLCISGSTLSKQQLLRMPILKDLLRYKSLTAGHVRIISSYQDPLTRAISIVFHQVYKQLGCKQYNNLSAYCFNELLLITLNLFIQGLPHPLEEFEADFFEREHFDHEAKCCYILRKNYEILVVNLLHSNTWEQVLAHNLGFKGIKIDTNNQNFSEQTANLYKSFTSNLTLPDSLIEQLYYASGEQKYLNWFCTDEEISLYYKQALSTYGEKRNSQPKSQLPVVGNHSPKPLAKITVLDCYPENDRNNHIHVIARLINLGETIWMPGPKHPGTIAFALRTTDQQRPAFTSNWHVITRQVRPGEEIVIDTILKLPPDFDNRKWHFDLICVGEYWFSTQNALQSKIAYPIAKMQRRKSPQRLVFLHIPKTAGTSLAKTITTNYGQANIFRYDRQEKLHFSKLGKYKVLSGHRPFKFYPKDLNLYVSITRNVVDRVASLYAHYVRPDLASQGNKLTQMEREINKQLWFYRGMDCYSITWSLENCKIFREAVSNTQCAYLSTGAATFNAALKTLRKYDFIVGSVEYMQLFLSSLSKLLGWQYTEEHHLNKSRSGALDIVLAEDGARETIEKFNAEDIKLYNFIVEECNGLYCHLPHIDEFRQSHLYLNSQL